MHSGFLRLPACPPAVGLYCVVPLLVGLANNRQGPVEPVDAHD